MLLVALKIEEGGEDRGGRTHAVAAPQVARGVSNSYCHRRISTLIVMIAVTHMYNCTMPDIIVTATLPASALVTPDEVIDMSY